MPDDRKGWSYQLDTSQKLLVFSLVLLPLIAWLGPLENISFSYIDETLTDAGLIYATARGINALVSVIQTTELDAQLASVQIGQLLDPLNDLIERFSSVMLFALGSLALQKILLELVTDFTFTFVLGTLAFFSIGCLLTGEKRVYPTLVRAFWITVFLRFSLFIVVMANSWVDSTFLAEREAAAHQHMEEMKSNLAKLKSGTLSDQELEQQLTEAREKKSRLTETLNQELTTQRRLESEESLERAELDLALKDEPYSCRFGISDDSCSARVAQLKRELREFKNDLQQLQPMIAALNKELKEQTKTIDCLNQRSFGEACGFIDSFMNKISVEKNLEKFQANMSDFVDNTVSLLMSMLLKTIVIPLAFLYCLLKILSVSWRKVETRPLPQAEH